MGGEILFFCWIAGLLLIERRGDMAGGEFSHVSCAAWLLAGRVVYLVEQIS